MLSNTIAKIQCCFVSMYHMREMRISFEWRRSHWTHRTKPIWNEIGQKSALGQSNRQQITVQSTFFFYYSVKGKIRLIEVSFSKRPFTKNGIFILMELILVFYASHARRVLACRMDRSLSLMCLIPLKAVPILQSVFSHQQLNVARVLFKRVLFIYCWKFVIQQVYCTNVVFLFLSAMLFQFSFRNNWKKTFKYAFFVFCQHEI